MKPSKGKYLINPFPMILANPGKGKPRKKAKRRNPVKKHGPGIFVIRAAKNPIKKISLGNNETLARGVDKQSDGTFTALTFSRSKSGFKSAAAANAWLKRKTAAKNPIKRAKSDPIKKRLATRDRVIEAIERTPSDRALKTDLARANRELARALRKLAARNPMKSRRRKASRRNPLKRVAKKRRSVRRQNAVKAIKRRRRAARKIVTRNPMSKKTRRRGKSRRSRNPMTRSGKSRRSGRRSSRRMRNPIPVVRELFNSDMLSLAAGVVGANIGTTMIMNRLVAGDPTTGARTFDLPGVDYSMLGNPATAGQFYAKNGLILAFYKLAIGGVAGFALRNQSPRLSRGIMIGTVATAISDVMRNTGVLSPTGTLQLSRVGTGRNFAAGVGFLPGTDPRFTGPGQRFLRANDVPRPRGMGAAVGPNMVRNTQATVEGSFRGAN